MTAHGLWVVIHTTHKQILTLAGSPPAAVSLFSFSVTDLAGRSFYITRSATDFQALHKRLAEYGNVRRLPSFPPCLIRCEFMPYNP